MSTIFTGYCNSTCSHPSCWINYRNILKNQVNVLDNTCSKPLSVVIPHQSILNINLDNLPYVQHPSKTLTSSPQNKNNNDIFDYLSSRKKISSPHVPHVTPYVASTTLKESTNSDNCYNRVSHLDVHEIFDMEELQSDWKRTFKSKDIYVWIPGQKAGRHSQVKKESENGPRIIKTPVMQLVPVLEDRPNLDRKKSNLSSGSEMNIKNTNASAKRSTLKKVQKTKPEKLPISISGVESQKENIRQKSLESAFLPQKMLIHNITDRGLARFEIATNTQIYILDPVKSDTNFDKFYEHQNKPSPRSMNSLDSNTNGLLNLRNPIQNQNQPLSLKSISIIDSRFAIDGLHFGLEPQKLIKGPNMIISSRTESSVHSLSTDTNSPCDSMIRNALSNRSTLNDEDLLPGGLMMKILQNSHQLTTERSENLDGDNLTKLVLDNMNDQTQITSSLMRSTRSAPDNNLQIIPNPPPPSPEISNRLRSTSADANLNRTVNN